MVCAWADLWGSGFRNIADGTASILSAVTPPIDRRVMYSS
jgi:hypothetical protein